MDEQLPFEKSRERLEGDRDRALELLPLARKLLYHVRLIASTAEVPIFSATRRQPDGSTIHAATIAGMHSIRVVGAPSPAQAVERKEEFPRRKMRFYGRVNLGALSPTSGWATDRVGLFVFDEDLTKAKHIGIQDLASDSLAYDGKPYWRVSQLLSQHTLQTFTIEGGFGPYSYSTYVGVRTIDTTVYKGEAPVIDGMMNTTITGPTRVPTGTGVGDRFDATFVGNSVDTLWYEYHLGCMRLSRTETNRSRTSTYPYGGGLITTPSVGTTSLYYYRYKPGQGLSPPSTTSPASWWTEVDLPSVSTDLYVVGYQKAGFIRKTTASITGVGSVFVDMFNYGDPAAVKSGLVPDHPFFGDYPKPAGFGPTGQAYNWWYVCTYDFMILWWFGADKRVWLGRLKYGQTTFDKVVALDTIANPMDGHPVDGDRWAVVNVDGADIE